MVPGYSNGLTQGQQMPTTGTAADCGCLVCWRRFTHRYWSCDTGGKSSGPYCAEHFPAPQAQER